MTKDTCNICNKESEDDQMVACDRCSNWFHYACVNVDDSVKDSDWFCPTCEAWLQDVVQRRADAMAAELAEKLEQCKIISMQNGNLASSESTDNTAPTSATLSSNEKEHAPTDTDSDDISYADASCVDPQTKLEMDLLQDERDCQMKFIQRKYEILKKSQQCAAGAIKGIPSATIGDVTSQGKPLSAKFATVEDVIQPSIATNQSPIFSQNVLVNNNTTLHIQTPMTKLTEQHKLARRTIGEDLPMFSGNIMEWPLFYTNFEESTRLCGYTDWENRKRLDKCLLPPARDYVKSLLIFPQNVPTIISTLKMKYGRSSMVIDSMLAHVEQLPMVPPNKFDKVIDFSINVNNLCAMIQASGDLSHLENPIFLKKITSKLPPDLCKEWAIYKSSLKTTNLLTLSTWMNNQAEIASMAIEVSSVQSYSTPFDTSTLKRLDHRQKPENRQAVKPTTYRVNTHTDSANNNNIQTTKRVYKCRMCSKEDHQISQCGDFAKLGPKERICFIRKHNLCEQCLRYHLGHRCFRNRDCAIDGCTKKHNPLLHDAVSLAETQTLSNEKQSLPTEKKDCHTHLQTATTTMFKVVPITLYGPKGTVSTFAFLDDGSSVTLLDSRIAEQLGVDGPKQKLCLTWTGDVNRVEAESMRVSLAVSGVSGVKYQMDGVRTVKKLDLPTQSFQMSDYNKLPHLRDIVSESYFSAEPKILIGIDQSNLSFPLQSREGGEGEPSAVNTRLGWVIYGPTGESKVNRVLIHTVEENVQVDNDRNLHQLVKNYFAIEEAGVQSKSVVTKYEERACLLLETTTKRIDKSNHFETGLLWRFDDFTMPNSYHMALKRLICLESKMQKDQEFMVTMNQQIDEYLVNNYARKLSPEEAAITTPRTWILPIFAVKNINKPKKVRVVWDAAAAVQGVSLNHMLLKGPDLLCSLMEVIFRFRQKPVAICGDIKHMFHQVKIKVEDQDSQRFLWRYGDSSRDPDYYVMNVMTFGASCSPSSAQFVKNRNAEEFRDQYPRAADAIVSNHYVDDYLDSVDTEADAIRLANEVKYIHSKAGFLIRNWLSNAPAVQNSLDEVQPMEDKDLNSSDTPNKILGMWWSTTTDAFTFKINFARIDQKIIYGTKKPTKRELLRLLISIYDPLGLIAFLLVNLKILLQDVWRCGIDWDEELPDSLYQRWLMWFDMLSVTGNVSIPRCYLPSATTILNTQLHVFCDASESAYATVAYLRFETPDSVIVSLTGSKTKVAPLHPASIPRLELQAAILGTRYSKTITAGHTIKIDEVIYWTDSEVVLRWLRSDVKKYKQYVALRVGEIIENTDVKQWRWVPSKINVADDATKWSTNSSVSSENRWFKGPDFLYAKLNDWPIDKTKSDGPPDVELKSHHLVHNIKKRPKIVVPDAARIRYWKILVHAQAYVRRYITALRCRVAKKKKKISLPKIVVPKVLPTVEPDEPIALTPNHFLIGSSSGTKPIGEFDDNDALLRKNWRKSQDFSNLFWRRWITEYLPTLIRREKWNEPVTPIKVGDIVVMYNDNERNSWQRGIIVDAIHGSGNQVHSVVVKTAKGTYTRPSTKVAVLDVASVGKSPA